MQLHFAPLLCGCSSIFCFDLASWKTKEREESKEKVLKQSGILLLEIGMSLVSVSKYPVFSYFARILLDLQFDVVVVPFSTVGFALLHQTAYSLIL